MSDTTGADVLRKLMKLQTDLGSSGLSDELIDEYSSVIETVMGDVAAIEEEANTDNLTGSGIRGTVKRAYDLANEEEGPGEKHYAVIMIDVDTFKLYNDSFGHQQGDSALQYVARTIHDSVHRSTDMINAINTDTGGQSSATERYGGEEFSILLNEVTEESAQMVAERIRYAVESGEIDVLQKTEGEIRYPLENPQKVTISVGFAVSKYQNGETLEDVRGYADRALYKAKEDGRNRVVLAKMDQSGLVFTVY